MTVSRPLGGPGERGANLLYQRPWSMGLGRSQGVRRRATGSSHRALSRQQRGHRLIAATEDQGPTLCRERSPGARKVRTLEGAPRRGPDVRFSLNGHLDPPPNKGAAQGKDGTQ